MLGRQLSREKKNRYLTFFSRSSYSFYIYYLRYYYHLFITGFVLKRILQVQINAGAETTLILRFYIGCFLIHFWGETLEDAGVGTSPYSKGDYLLVLLGATLLTTLVGLLFFLLLKDGHLHQVLAASVLAGTLISGLLIRWRRKRLPREPVEQWPRKERYIETAVFIIPILLIIMLFQGTLSLLPILLACLSGIDLGAFFLLLKPPSDSNPYGQGLGRTIRLFVFGFGFGAYTLSVIYFLLQRLRYFDLTFGLAVFVLLGAMALLVYHIGKLAMS